MVIDEGKRVLAGQLTVTILLALAVNRVDLAQAPEEVARWSAEVDGTNVLRRHSTATLDVSGKISAGWHIYAIEQKPGGPTPLRIALEDNSIARGAGPPSGTAPDETHDPSFDLDTRFYRHSLVLHVPIVIKTRAEVGSRVIPLEVRFQSCNDRICLPPKTVRLSVPVTVLPDT